jgi:aminoglycoside phosphotransferase (APT) family kinase protein
MPGEKKHIDGVMGDVVSSSKKAYAAVDEANIKRFIEAQDDIAGEVCITNVRGGAEKAGASSGIVLFSAGFDEGNGPVNRDFVLRYDPMSENRLFFEYDIKSQFVIQKALQDSDVPVARPYWIDEEGKYLGLPGYIMEHIEGDVPTATSFISGLFAEAGPEAKKLMLDDVIKTLVKLHSVDWRALGLENMVKSAEGATPLSRFINWFWKTWDFVAPEDYEKLVPIRDWLLKNQPEVSDPVLMHGDSNFSNYMFRDNRVVAVLDWELCSLGIRELDISIQNVSNEFFSHLSGVTEGVPKRSEWVELYEKMSGCQLKYLDYTDRLASYMIIIVFYSQNRNLPEAKRTEHIQLTNFYWDKFNGI